MSYYLTKMLSLPFGETVARVTEALKIEGFGNPPKNKRGLA
jgi:hypothetical protein